MEMNNNQSTLFKLFNNKDLNTSKANLSSHICKLYEEVQNIYHSKKKKHKGNQGISSLNITGNLREQYYLKKNKRERQSDWKFPDMYKNKKS